MTEYENKTFEEFFQLQTSYWPKFMSDNFQGWQLENMTGLNEIDWLLVMLNEENPELYSSAISMQERCNQMTNTSCFEVLTDPSLSELTSETTYYYAEFARSFWNQMNSTTGFRTAFSALWRSRLPCFDTKDLSAVNEGERGILKKCKWKNVVINCSAIFTTFPTDRGMCCSFNIKAADEIFTSSEFSKLVKELQADDSSMSFDNSTLPEYYISGSEPRSQAGINLGLEVVLDAHSNLLESFSVSQDFEGFTGLINEPDSFPLSKQRGFQIKPGHYNLVAISAIRIDADDGLKTLTPDARKCLFPDEKGNMELFKNYSQSNCLLECSLKYAQRTIEQTSGQGCTPWFFPFYQNSSRMCDPYQTVDILAAMETVSSDECDHCLPDCRRTLYDQKVTTQPFRRCDERNLYVSDFCKVGLKDTINPQIWVQQVIDGFLATEGKVPKYLAPMVSNIRNVKDSYILQNFFPGLPKKYDAFEKDIAVVNVFFDTSTVMQFQSLPSQSWIGYFSNVGGALGLCIGLSIMTLMELVFLCFRVGGLCKKNEIHPTEVKPFLNN